MLGYACINLSLRQGADKVTTNRSLIKRTYEEKGLPYVSQLVEQNSEDLISIICWNESRNIKFFRLSSAVFPFIEWYDFEDLPGFDKVEQNLAIAGQNARHFGQRITQHPDHFVKLASKDLDYIEQSKRTLAQAARVFDIMGLSRTVFNKMNIHIGGVYGDKEKTAERFCRTVETLPESVRSRLTVENDDKGSSYSVVDLYDLVYKRTGVPIVFDYHHHRFNDGGLTEEEALKLAASTWPDDIKPVVHYSEPRPDYHEDSTNPRAHSDYVFNPIDTYGLEVDVMLEAKAKELALLEYRKKKEVILI